MARRKRQLRIRVLQRGGAPEAVPFMEDMARRIVPKMFSTRMANTLCLRIELRSSKMKSDRLGEAHYSTVHDPSKKRYLIIVHRDLLPTQMAKTLAHELAHVKQYIEGRLRHGKRETEAGHFWKPTREGEGQFFPYATTDYWTSPWEVEARELSALGSEAMKERVAEANAKADTREGRMMQYEHSAIQDHHNLLDLAREQRQARQDREKRRRVLGVRI